MWILLWMFRYISSLSNIFFAFWFIIGHFNSYYLKSKKFKTQHKNHNCVLIQYHQITHAIGNWPAKVKVSENIIIKIQLSAQIIPVFLFHKPFLVISWLSVIPSSLGTAVKVSLRTSTKNWLISLVKTMMWQWKVKKNSFFKS